MADKYITSDVINTGAFAPPVGVLADVSTVGTTRYSHDIFVAEGVTVAGVLKGIATVSGNPVPAQSGKGFTVAGTVMAGNVGIWFFVNGRGMVSISQTGQAFGYVAAQIHSPGGSFLNAGYLQGITHGVTSAIDNGTFENSGTIVASDPTGSDPLAGVAVLDSSASVDVMNSGEINGGTVGFVHKTGTGTVSFTNTGAVNGIDGSITMKAGVLNLHNAGTLTGNVTLAKAASADAIVNTGQILGDIKFAGGNDRYDGNSGIVTGMVSGGSGRDVLIGGLGNDVLHGDGGNDVVQGGGGDDLILGGTGNDRLGGGAGDDTLSGGDGTDRLNGGDGADIMGGGAGSDLLHGGNGDDVLFGNTIVTSGGGVVVAAATAIATDGADVIFGGAGNDQISGGDGDDMLYGGSGDDTIHGGAGTDLLRGGSGDDTLSDTDGMPTQMYGGSGNDRLSAGDGSDILVGGAGDDQITVTGGTNIIRGGSGDDAITGGSGSDDISGGSGSDLIDGGGGIDTISGGVGRDTIRGGAGNDSLMGDDGNDRLFGDAGADGLIGGNGNDELSGGSGSDILVGGAGDDILTGDGGADTFMFQHGFGNDIISDFTDGTDLLDLTALGLFSASQVTGNATDSTVGVTINLTAEGGGWITLLGMTTAQLDASDFLI